MKNMILYWMWLCSLADLTTGYDQQFDSAINTLKWTDFTILQTDAGISVCYR
jgi:hypothetical protein